MQKKMLWERFSHQKFRLTSVFLFFVFLLWGLTAAQEFAWYCRPFGTIDYRGDVAPNGLKVEAFIGGQAFAPSQTKNGEYSLAIPKDDPATSKKEGWAEGDLITIKVGDFTALPNFRAFSGTKRVNLRVPTLDVKPTTWGKIKALFK